MQRHNKDFLTAYLEYTKFHEASPRIHHWVGISILAASMQRKVWMNRGFYLLYPNLYTIIVGQSGLIKKSTSTAIGVNMLRELHDFPLMAERTTATSFISQIVESLRKFRYRNSEINQSAIFCYASELRVFMEIVWGSMAELLTTMFDCQPSDPSKPWIYKNMGHGEYKIYGPCLNLLGASTPAWLTRCIPPEDMEGGFASRCLFVAQLDAPENPVAWPEMTSDLNQKRQSLIHDLKIINSLTGAVHITDQARVLYETWYNHHTKNVIPKNSDSRFAGYLGRKGDQILKLAMIKSVSESNNLEITHEHIIWATETIEELEPNMMYIFNMYDPNVKKTLIPMGTTMNLTEEIMKYVTQMGTVEISEVRKMFLNKNNIEPFVDALAKLTQSGYLNQEMIQNPGSGAVMKMISLGPKIVSLTSAQPESLGLTNELNSRPEQVLGSAPASRLYDESLSQEPERL